MDIYDKYDELQEIVDKLDSLIDDITIYKEIKEDLEYIKFDAKRELEYLEPEIQKLEEEQERAQNNEYWKSQF